MLARLPLETIDHIFEYLDFEDIRSVACVCLAFRWPAQLRLFRTIPIATNTNDAYPNHIDSILSSPHLLQHLSVLIVQCFGFTQQHEIPTHPLKYHLYMVHRLSNIELCREFSDCSRVLSALESCNLPREIALRLWRRLDPDMLISDNPLPVHTLELTVHESNPHVATQLVQKCSQSLRQLDLFLKDDITLTLPFLPHLYELSLIHAEPSSSMGIAHDLMSWLPFLGQHPTITRLSLGGRFTLAVQCSPNLLPNLRSLEASPAMIERLIPGRPVNDIHISYPSVIARRFPVDVVLQPLRQPFVPVTTLEITTDTNFLNDVLINIVQALPKLRKFTLTEPKYDVRQLFEGRRYSKLIGSRVLPSFKTC
jgi:hypothetical protein